jgi:hypothetical protein
MLIAPEAGAADGAQATLTVALHGVGGTVTSDPPGIACPTECESGEVAGTQVALTAAGDRPGRSFLGWSGACVGSQPTCTFALKESTRVGATFGPTPHWGRTHSAKSVTDPRQFLAPLKGYDYGPWLDNEPFGSLAIATATNRKTGALAYIQVYSCYGPQPCVTASSPLTATKLAGRRVYTYLINQGSGVVRLIPQPSISKDPRMNTGASVEIIVISGSTRDALDIMTQLNRANP